jgi:hypothetical protein
MNRKTADQIQAEIDLIRLAYRQRIDPLNHINPLVAATPYLISAALVLGLAGFLVSLLFS